MTKTQTTESPIAVSFEEWLPRELCEALLDERVTPDGGVFGDLCHCSSWDSDGYCRSCGWALS